jgi:hypothetical protein
MKAGGFCFFDELVEEKSCTKLDLSFRNSPKFFTQNGNI